MKTESPPHRLSQNNQISNFMKIMPVGTEFFLHARKDRQADMTKLMAGFTKIFANSPNNCNFRI